MSPRKKLMIGVGVVLVVMFITLLSINTYTSSPGFTSQEAMDEFYANPPKCYGIDILLNKEATWADAPGRSFCVGYLRR